MSVGMLCNREFDRASPDEVLVAAARRMLATGAEVLVVEGGDRQVVGLLTERRILACVLDAEVDPAAARVRDAAPVGSPTVSADESAEVALRHMLDAGTRWIVVTDGMHHAVGLLSLDHLLRLLLGEIAALGALLRNEDAVVLWSSAQKAQEDASRGDEGG